MGGIENEQRPVEQRPVLEAAIDTYMTLLPEMLLDHEGEWVVIRDEDAEPQTGFWHSQLDAYKVAVEKFGNVPMLVWQVSREYLQFGRYGKPVTMTRDLGV